MIGVSERAISVRSFRRFEYPEEVAAEIDVLPSEWGDMTNEMIWNGIAAPASGFDGAFEIDGVPEDDGRDDEVEVST